MRMVMVKWGLALTCLLLPGLVRADTAEMLKTYVADNTAVMLERLESERKNYSKEPENFYTAMQEVMAPFIDYRRIAARVMGRHSRVATLEQRDLFVEKFRRSLFDTYAKALIEAKDFRINVTGAQVNQRNPERATVDLEVISASGNRYPVTYSMYLAEGDRWMMENVIVEGVNIGLAFRERFDQSMERLGSVDAVIQQWSGAVEALDKKSRERTATQPPVAAGS